MVEKHPVIELARERICSFLDIFARRFIIVLLNGLNGGNGVGVVCRARGQRGAEKKEYQEPQAMLA